MVNVMVCKYVSLIKYPYYECMINIIVSVNIYSDELPNVSFRKHKYEVLINPDRAARLEWRSYNKFAGVPIGAVAAVDESSEPSAGDNNVFIGRHLGKSGSWRPGAVEVPRRSSYSSFGVMRQVYIFK